MDQKINDLYEEEKFKYKLNQMNIERDMYKENVDSKSEKLYFLEE